MGVVYDKVKDFDRRFPGGIAWRMKKHSDTLEKYLNPGEEVQFAFCAQKNDKFYDIFSTCAFCLTNKRIMMARKRMLWGSFFYSVTPDLYNDSQVYSGLVWGKLTIDTVKETIVLSNLPKAALDDIETSVSEFMMREKRKYKDDEN